MSNYNIGQDVLVESDDILDGEAFIASVDAETENLLGDGVVVDTRGRDGLPALAQVGADEVLTLTEVFDTIRATETLNTVSEQ